MHLYFAPIIYRSLDVDLNLSILNKLYLSKQSNIELHFAPYSSFTVDSIAFLLSYINQMSKRTKCKISILCDGSITASSSNFYEYFSYIHPTVPIRVNDILLDHCHKSTIARDRIIKLINIKLDASERSIPTQLTDIILDTQKDKNFSDRLSVAIYTILAELIGNISQHGSSDIDGFAGVEIADEGKTVRIAVSDSGMGILHTLRPTLSSFLPKLAGFDDKKLLLEVFKKGISRHGPGRGCGLKTSADWALRFNATMDIRLPGIRVILFPCNGEYLLERPLTISELPEISGTHICFTFPLDTCA